MLPRKLNTTVHACPFGLRTRLELSWEAWDGLLDVDLGTRVVTRSARQAPGECWVAPIDATSALANNAVELVGVEGRRSILAWQR